MYSFQIDLKDHFDCSNIKENILNDYEIIKSIYLDNIEEICNDGYLDHEEDIQTELKKSQNISFKLNLKLEMEADSALIELIEDLKFSDMIVNSNTIGLPYWIKFEFDNKEKILDIKFFIFWYKKNSAALDEFTENYCSQLCQDSIFFPIVEEFKNFIKTPEKKLLINWLQQMKEELVIVKGDISIDNIIYNNDNPNKNFIQSHEEKEDESASDNLSLLKARSNKILENSKQKQEKNLNENSTTNRKVQNEGEYETFLNDGGLVGEIITDRGSTFQAHAIRINTFNDVSKYLKILKTNNKIFKATHNIMAYRVLDNSKNPQDKNKTVNKTKKNNLNLISEGNITQGFDEDGEDGAGIRLLGILEKMKIVNVMVVVSRWFGEILLGNDRFKHINDSAKNLINKNKNNFDYIS